MKSPRIDIARIRREQIVEFAASGRELVAHVDELDLGVVPAHAPAKLRQRQLSPSRLALAFISVSAPVILLLSRMPSLEDGSARPRRPG